MIFPGLSLSSAPTEEPVSLVEAKAYLRVEHDEEDSLLQSMITVARRVLEKELWQQFITATWIAYYDRFPGWHEMIELPLAPLQSVSSIAYVDSAGDSQTLSGSLYQVDTKRRPGRIAPARGQCWPSTECETLNAVTITFVAGYGAATAVPETIKAAIKERVAEYYDDREKLRQALTLADWHGQI